MEREWKNLELWSNLNKAYAAEWKICVGCFCACMWTQKAEHGCGRQEAASASNGFPSIASRKNAAHFSWRKKNKFLTGPLAPRVPTTIPGTRAGTGIGARGRSEHVASCARVNTGGKRGGRLGGAALPNASILFLEKARPTHTSWKMDYLS